MENNNDFLNSVHSEIDDNYIPDNGGNNGRGPSGGGVDLSKILPIAAILIAVVVLAIIFVPKILEKISGKEEDTTPTESVTETYTTEEYTTDPLWNETTTEEITTEETTTEAETTKKQHRESTTTTTKKDKTTKTTTKVDSDAKVKALQNIPKYRLVIKDDNGKTIYDKELTWSEMSKTTKFGDIPESEFNAYIASVKKYANDNDLNSEIGASIDKLSKAASDYYSKNSTTAKSSTDPTTTTTKEPETSTTVKDSTNTTTDADSGEVAATTKKTA
ncbi:MAG: hypothetical protein K5756_00665 [Clostridiales bacterium]|nr:hypothetical protein [Clostridiales bacterium]